MVRIDALLGAARAGRGSLLQISGPAGIGKSSLLGVARERAGLAGMRILSARGGQLESGFSFGIARQLFEPLLADAGRADRNTLLAGAARRAPTALGDVPDSVDGAAESGHPFALCHSLYWLTVNTSGTAPVLVTIDDLHWADRASLRFVLYLADRLVGLPIALAVAWRPGEAVADGTAESLARLEPIAAGGPVSPDALSHNGVRTLLTGAFASVPCEEFTAACHAATGGNPFLVGELIASLHAEGIVPEESGVESVTALGPRPVARAVTGRIARLGPTAGELTRAAAILGDGAALRHAAALAGISLADAAAAADRLAEMGVFKPGTPLNFVHSIVRTAVHDDIPEASRGLRHAEAARLLAAEGADPDAVCAHLLACEPAGSSEVVGQLRAAAARAAARGAPESAVVYLRRAVAETADVALRATLLYALGLAEKVVLDPLAAGHLRESLELAGDPAQRVAASPDLIELLVLAGQWDAGAEVARTARRELAACDAGARNRAGAAVGRLETWWAAFAAFDLDLVGEFDRCLDELLATAWEETEPRVLAAALAGILAWRGERTAVVRALLDHALESDGLLARVDSDPLIVMQALAAVVWIDELARAEALAARLLTLSRSRGSVWALGTAALLSAAVQVRRGDLVSTATDVRTVIELATEHGGAFAIPSALFWGADALTERPELGEIAALATATELDPGLERTATGAMLREVRGRLALAAGDFATARAELHEAAGIYDALHLLNPGTGWRSMLALALASADRGQALREASRDLEDSRRAGLTRPTGIALRTRGMLEGGRQGLEDLREAVGVLAGSGSRLEYARAQVELGAALRRANQRAEAREPLRDGLDLAYRCGAERLAQRAAAELRATGARLRRAVLTGVEALTPSERRVAQLAASGMSNPEIAQALFVTLNTVEGHLRHVYPKLSISSRRQLPAALASAVPRLPEPPGVAAQTEVD